MTMLERLRARHDPKRPLVGMSASGQLGYGVIAPAFEAGVARKPDFIGADMGSVDPGPYYLGAGVMATGAERTKRDLRMLLLGARKLDVPMLLGTAGTGGASPHLDATLAMIREIAREEGLHFNLASIRADISSEAVIAAQRAGGLLPLGRIPVPTEEDIRASRIVGQMGTSGFVRALEMGADVVIAGRACDTGIFAAVPQLLGYPMGLALHMAKIIECCSLCCLPGGRDSILGHLTHDDFVLESMNPDRHATPLSVAAHVLYEQDDPFSVSEPEGKLLLRDAQYEAVDQHRTRCFGAQYEEAIKFRIKIEGAQRLGARAVMLAGSADPVVIEKIDEILRDVETMTRSLYPHPFQLYPRVYGRRGVPLFEGGMREAEEIFILVECVAATAEIAKGAMLSFKQYCLHHGFAGRLSTGGNLAFPITPPELDAGDAYRFSLYHLMDVDRPDDLFPITFEQV